MPAQTTGGGHHLDRSGSESDDTDSWISTGDIAEQIDEEDPLRARLNETLDVDALVGLKHLSKNKKNKSNVKKEKHVRIHPDTVDHFRGDRSSQTHTGIVNKEAIVIPEPSFRGKSKGSRLLAAIMPVHSMTGKTLIYFTSVFVSLGVFLFGYDQGKQTRRSSIVSR